MRTQMFGLSLILSALIGCGGGGKDKGPDAKIFLDAPIDAPPACAVMDSLGGLNLVNAMQSDYIDTDRMGSLAGRTVLSIGGRLPSSTAALLDILVVDYVKPTAGGFVLNTAQNFNPDPKAAPFIAASYVFGDLDMAAGNTIQNLYYASSGSITVTAVGETAGAPIKGSVAATAYREIDDMDADVAGGCVTALTALNFDVVHNGMNFQNNQGQTGPGLIPLTKAEWAAVNEVRAARGH